jgi:L-ascorbate metabolism protein UlaG (beta-lactamase superfamily)
MQLTWYGHSAFRIEAGGAVVLIDPFLTGNPKWQGGWQEVADGVTHVLLTHGHNDHFGDTVEIARATGAQVVCVAEIAGHLGRVGIDAGRLNQGNTGGTLDCGGFTTSFVNALHSSSLGGDGAVTYMGHPNGLVLHFDGGKTLYHMGDTDIFGDMALINELHAPDIGIVPIGDRFTMGGAVAALACRRFFQFEAVIPCHFGTFPILDQTADAFVAGMGGDAGKVVLPEIGAPFEI